MQKTFRKNKGITLVALVVTVIILLILAGISIVSLTGNGLFEKAKLAKEKQENAQIEENEILDEYQSVINSYNTPNSVIAGNRGSIEKDLLYSNDSGWNDTSNPITLSKSWNDYQALIFIGKMSNSFNEWTESWVSNELLTIMMNKYKNNESDKILMLAHYYNYFVSLKINDYNTIECHSYNDSCNKIYYIYGVK